ncbi:poly(A)-specific ribonuclease PNLDC1-like [Lineus longissimus]|uniref:poly(A)-specific ribonuclease PNLDC1-like n=1 Tax=Lineus longissimus TaxID=88925 RepID=UPI00315C6AC9
MVDIDRTNFEDHFESMVEAIRNADFIALDTEFTGLRSSAANTPSLFDTGEARYKKVRRSVLQIAPSQMGVSVFINQKQQKTKYTSHTFNIYLIPQSFGPVDQRFLCQASSLEFLCKHNFDFNKFIYTGVSYLNDEQEKKVKFHLKSDAFLEGVDRDVDERVLQKFCSVVAEWRVQAKEAETTQLHLPEGIGEYFIQIELKQRFLDLWPEVEKEDGQTMIKVKKVSANERKTLEVQDRIDRMEQEKQCLDKLLGFTRIFREIVRSKKPVCGHNMLMDLMMWYDKFYKPLPENYKTFKLDIHRMFPYIFDTKHMSAKLRRPFLETGLLEDTGLAALFKTLVSQRTATRFLYCPSIAHADGMDRYKNLEKPHEAGYDAFMTGGVFLQLCHMYCQMDTKAEEMTKLAFRQYLPIVTELANNVNIIRASTNHANFSGADPPTQRPECLIFRSKRTNYKFNTSELAGVLSQYGTVDVRLQGSHQALVAVGNIWCAKDILREFSKHEHIKVCKYNIWKHSPVVRRVLWTGAIVSVAVCLWAVLSPSKQK